jgi:Peptidase_C39 like family
MASPRLALAALILLGCGAVPSPPPDPAPEAAFEAPRPAYAKVIIEGVPHVRQKPDFCGEACVEMALRKLGRPLDQDEVFNRSGLDPSLGRGVNTAELKTALERIGFLPGPVWSAVEADRAGEGLTAEFEALHADLRAGVPSIVCMHYDDRPDTTEHFRLVLGYDPAADEVVYHEPAVDAGAYRRMTRPLFLKLWPLKYDARRWTVIRFRLVPGVLSTDHEPRSGVSPADVAQQIMALRARMGRER